MQNTKTLILAALIFSAISLPFLKAHATITLEQPIESSQTANNTNWSETILETTNINLFYIDTKIKNNTSFFTGTVGGDYAVTLYEGTFPGITQVASFKKSSTNGEYIRFVLCTAPGSCGSASTTNFILNSSQQYTLEFNGILDDFSQAGSINPNSYSNGCASTNIGQTCTGDNVKDLFFKFRDKDDTSTLEGTNFIEITTPENNYNGAFFPAWNINWSFNATTTASSTYYARIRYNQTENDVNFPNNTQYTDETLLFSGAIPSTISGSSTIPVAAPTLPIGDYYAKAYLMQENFFDGGSIRTDIASSTIVQFTLTTSENPNYGGGECSYSFFGTTTPEERCEDKGFVEKNICKVLVWSFVPSCGVMERYVGLKDTIERKPPIGYYSVFRETLENATTTANPIFYLPTIEGITTPIRTGLSWFFWLLFGFYIIKRVSHLNI